MNKEEFIQELKKIKINPTEKQMNLLEEFYNLMIEWNKKINLTRIIEKEEVYLKHYYDSLTLNKVVDLNNVKSLCDVGSGAGFPGIVIKIMFPEIKVVLIDSLQKRVNYLNEVIKKLELKDIIAVHTRGEEYKGQFEVVTSRAVANIEKLVKYTMHLVSKNGIFIAMKGNLNEEINIINKAEFKNKYKIHTKNVFYLPKENSIRTLLVLKNK